MLKHGHNQTQNQLTLFAEDSPVRTFQTPASVPVLTEIVVDYSLKSSVSLAKFDPDSLSWRTSQLCLTGGLTEFSGNWPRSGLMLNGTAYQLPPLVPRTSGIGCGLSPMWPTPTSADGTFIECRNKKPLTSMRLSERVLWPTPTASDWKRRGPNSRHQGLPEIVKNWPTPTASSWGSTGHRAMLQTKVDNGTISESDKKQMTSGNGGKLNPAWVEWLMGFPSGWTDLDA